MTSRTTVPKMALTLVAVQVSGKIHRMIKKASTAMIPEAPNSPMLSPFCGLPPSLTFTRNDPAIDTRMPTPASASGNNTAANLSTPTVSPKTVKNPVPSTIVPMIEPT